MNQIILIEHNMNPNWLEANQLAILQVWQKNLDLRLLS